MQKDTKKLENTKTQKHSKKTKAQKEGIRLRGDSCRGMNFYQVSFLGDRCYAMELMEMALQVGVESLCYAMDSNEIPEVLEDQSLPYLEGEFKLLGNMFKHEKLMKTDREKILVADIPYNIPSLGDGIWNKSSPFFLPRFLKWLRV